MKKRLLAILLLVVGLVSAVPMQVGAVPLGTSITPQPTKNIATPDTPPAINAVYVYNLYGGGVGVFVDYTLDYASLPNQSATQSFLVVFIDTDGTTQLKAVAPYTYVDNGYGRGVAWIPFSSAESQSLGLDSTQVANYRVWLVGNPTLTWTPVDVPPKTVATIDNWYSTGDPRVLLALQILNYASTLETAWTVDMIEVTTLGSKLTANGEAYFENVIPNARTLAPTAFAAQEYTPTMESINYSSTFGAIAVSSILVGSPVTLQSGVNNLVTTGAGTIAFYLTHVTYGNVTGAVVTGSPDDITPGTNNVTITGAGAIVANVASVAPGAIIAESVNNTAFDTSDSATAFGFSRNWMSGLVWFVITMIICGATYTKSKNVDDYTGGRGKAVLLVFMVCCIGGALLGLFPMQVVALVFVGSGAVIGYILFFRYTPDIGRTVMFMLFMFIVVGIAGNTMQGEQDFAVTQLTTTISDTDTTITVTSTDGFPSAGTLDINGERIAYAHKTATTFTGSGLGGLTNPLVRGTGGTTAASHTAGASVSTVQGAMMNAAMNYNLAVIADPTGSLAFISVGKALFSLLGSFMFLPLNFLGTDLAILTVFWAVFGVGLLVSATVAFASGSRRV